MAAHHLRHFAMPPEQRDDQRRAARAVRLRVQRRAVFDQQGAAISG